MLGDDFIFCQRILFTLVATEQFGKLLPIANILGESVDQFLVFSDRLLCLPFGKKFLAVTPGIRPEWTLLESDDQKRVTTPGQAVTLGSDYIVIGRPIRDADDPVMAAQKVAQEVVAVL